LFHRHFDRRQCPIWYTAVRNAALEAAHATGPTYAKLMWEYRAELDPLVLCKKVDIPLNSTCQRALLRPHIGSGIAMQLSDACSLSASLAHAIAACVGQ
jgi:hypothetical protein